MSVGSCPTVSFAFVLGLALLPACGSFDSVDSLDHDGTSPTDAGADSVDGPNDVRADLPADTADSGDRDTSDADPDVPLVTDADDVAQADTTDSGDVGVDVGSWPPTDHVSRIRVSWGQAPVVDNFVLPVDLSSIGTPNAARAYDANDVELAMELDGQTAWVNVPEFADDGELFIYFGGEDLPTLQPWADTDVGVWHLSSTRLTTNSTDPDYALVTSGSTSVTGIVGTGAAMTSRENPSPMEFAFAVPDLDGFNFPSDAVTVELWFKLNTDQVQYAAMSLFSNSGVVVDNQLYVAFAGGQQDILRAGRRVDGEIVSLADYNYGSAPTDWYYIGLTFDAGDDELRLFVNGSQRSSGETTSNWTPNNQLVRFGGQWFGGGILDELRISNVVRTPAFFQAVNFYYRPDRLTFDPVQTRP